ncbi:hypothetical protein EXN66_Car017355 [Channa argus]|uniref:Uncharacterized protein n=1 Tax=Channa argus TaxID=215402 RepID=A0A6G1QGS4_CHAAH|nr:hypothetical protein EXN66_Car017355 [Channa argus]
MDSSAANGCSSVTPREVSEELSHQAASFIRLWDKKEARMRDLLDEIKDMAIQIKKLHTKSKRSCYTGAVSAGVTIGAGIAVPFAGGLGFAITAALTSAAAGGALFGFKIKQFRTEEECLKQIKQFLKIVNRLQHELEEILKVCEDLQRESDKAETCDVSSLKSNLVKLFESTEMLRTADGVKELTGQCPMVFGEFQDIKTQLEEFRGSTECGSSSEISSESSPLILQQQDVSQQIELNPNTDHNPKKDQGNSTLDSAGGNHLIGGGTQTENLHTGLETNNENVSEMSPLILQQQDKENRTESR